jgi:hypothetical protein
MRKESEDDFILKVEEPKPIYDNNRNQSLAILRVK